MRTRRTVLRKLRRDQVVVRGWPHPGVPLELFYLVDATVPLTFAPDGRCYEQDELALVQTPLPPLLPRPHAHTPTCHIPACASALHLWSDSTEQTTEHGHIPTFP